MAKKDNTILYVALAGVGAYFLLSGSGSPVTAALSTAQSAAANLLNPSASPSVPAAQSYPWLISNAPAIPPVFDDIYYLTYIRPAMIAANPNVDNPNYQLTPTDQDNYMNNYLDLRQALPTWLGKTFPGNQKITTLPQAIQRHWNIYGIPDQRTFLPLPWSTTANYVPPPVNTKSSGNGLFGTLLKVATIAAGATITIASGGTLAPIVAPATSAALTAESAIHGPEDVLSDEEINIVVTSAAVIKKILPFYLQANPILVASIENKLDSLISQYAN